MPDQFVNPYTFVPLPGKAPQRAEPNGHQGKPELLSGKLSVRISARTPLLIRGFGERTSDGPANTLPRRPDGAAFVPGSSVKGAIRSLHETLTGSCLRVFDDEYAPSYRDSVTVRNNRVLAVVTRAPTADCPPKVALCKPGNALKDRVPQRILSRDFGGRLRSGQRLNVVSTDDNGKPTKIKPVADGEWVLFVSDSRARSKDKPYHAHIRRVTTTEIQIPGEVWETFLRVVEETDDRRISRRTKDDTTRMAPVIHEYQPKPGPTESISVGYRYRSGPDLECGQPVWVDVSGQEVTWIGLAMNWRHPATGPAAGARVGAFTPCDDPEHLCPSCRLLGSVDHNEREQGDPADQRSYRGHVRFGDALAISDVQGIAVTLPPMGAPRPGAGQAYLDNQKVPEDAKGDPPLREWGAVGTDGDNPRPLRGRKYYWQAAPNGREHAREHHRDKHAELTTTAEVFPEGTTFRATVTFTDLDEIQLGGLLAALQPSLLFKDSTPCTHLGGGKPLGLGQCQIEIDLAASEFHRNGARYGLHDATADVTRQPSLLIDAFRTSVGAEVKATWPLINRVLRPDAVPSDIVWYPPGARWATRKTGASQDLKAFDDGFAFWKQTSGFTSSKQRDGGYPLRSLPMLRAKPDHDTQGYDQAMDIVENES